MKNIVVSGSMQFLDDMRKCAIPIMQKGYSAILPEEDDWDSIKPEEINAYKRMVATVYKGNIIKNLIMDCQSYTKYRPNETTGGIFVSWRRKEELPTGA